MQTTTASDEAQLVAALQARDEAAYLELVRGYHASLLRVAQIYVPSRAVAEEVIQETWLGVLRGIDRFEGRSSLKTWVFRILTNVARTRATREGRHIPFSALDRPGRVPEAAVEADRFLAPDDPKWPGGWAVAPASWSPDDRLVAKETRDVVAAAIERLPPNQRAVISLRDVEGWGAEEVCNVLGLSESNQRVLLHRARSKVRAELERYLRGEPT
jgi:RNA polymerase sigma-70 factor (ECF subfamily)